MLTSPATAAAAAVARCAVVGRPVGHSLSPTLHRAGYEALSLDWRYDACEVDEDALAGFLDGLDDSWRGLSLTMPLKRAVVPLLDSLSEQGERALAANTVVLEGGRRHGHNTDIPGAVTALLERDDGPFDAAVVLGGGATATSTMLALADLGCRSLTVLVRDPARLPPTLDALARHPRAPEVVVGSLAAPAAPAADVLVSTLPATAPTLAGRTGLDVLGDPRVVFDVVYDPWPGPWQPVAAADGRTFVSGLDLLVHQAARQFELFTGVPEAPLAAMRRAGEAALARPQTR